MEESVLSVLRRIKNVILNMSLQGGQWLIEIIFMPIVVESFVLCGLLFLQQSGLNLEREEKHKICEKG